MAQWSGADYSRDISGKSTVGFASCGGLIAAGVDDSWKQNPKANDNAQYLNSTEDDGFQGCKQISGSPPLKIMKGAVKVDMQLGQGTHTLFYNQVFLVDCFQDQK